MYRYTLSLVAAATLVASTEAQELTLDPIVVSASKTEQTLHNVSANIDVISADEIAERHYTTLAEALNSLAGVGVVSNGGLGKSTSLYLRGFDSKRTLVLIDGIRYNDNTSPSGASFEHLMLGDIERIEVIKGAQSGIWGSDASAGVINIITRKTAQGTEAKALYEQGSFDTKKYGGSFGYKNDTLDLHLDARKIVSDGFTAYAKRNTDIEDYEDDGYENRTLGLNIGYRFDDANEIRFADTDIDVYSEYDFYNGDSAANYRKNERLSRLSYENRFGDALTTLYANRSTFDRDYSTGSTFDGEINEYGVHSRIGYHENDFIVIGGDYKTFEHRNSINREYDNRAVFITNTNILTTGTVVTESLRRDAFDAFIDKTTGKIGFKHPWSEKGYVSANYGTAYNVPTLYQLYVPTYGNTALKPEETRSYDLTVGYSGISLTYFESHIKEMIDFDLTSWVYSNVEGTSKIKGIEAVFKQELGSEALVSLGYTRLNAKNQRGESLGRRAKANLKFGLDYYGIPKAHIGLNGEYVGSRYDNDNDKGAQTGRYTVASLVADYAYTKHLKIYAKVDNITDKYYQSVNNYASSPRAWYAGMEVSF